MQKQQQLLEAEVETRAATVADWKRSIASIETQLNTANTALMRAKKQREIHALRASMGDAAAIAAVKTARDAQRDAESTIDDLRVALPAAQEQLAAAQKAEAAALAERAKFEAAVLKRELIETDAQIDVWLAAGTPLLDKRTRLVTEIINKDPPPRTMHGTSDFESAMGWRRVAAAILFAVPCLLKIYPNMPRDEQTKKEPLATADRRYYFGDEPVETTTTKAA